MSSHIGGLIIRDAIKMSWRICVLTFFTGRQTELNNLKISFTLPKPAQLGDAFRGVPFCRASGDPKNPIQILTFCIGIGPSL